MRINLIFIFVVFIFLQVSASSYGQKITLNYKQTTLPEIFKEIREQAGYDFFYKVNLIRKIKPIDIRVENASIEEVLDLCFKNQPFLYSIKNQIVVVKEKPSDFKLAMLEIDPGYTFQEFVVTGVVKDSLGAVLPGVSVIIQENPKKGTKTDANGRYSLNIPKGSTLVFTMIGFEPMEVKPDQAIIDIVLKESKEALSDVVITAFGNRVKREDMIGSVTSINPSELKVPSSNLTTALAGRIAGLIAYQRSGEPDKDNADFFIRGVTTFGYKKDPLILIDNMEMTTTDLARLQVDDIEGFSIMKDATATAVYGARGANGVILITTKQGKEGKSIMNFRFENSISAPTRSIELADPITYMNLHNEALQTRIPSAPIYSQEQIANTISGVDPFRYPVTDWQSMVLKDFTTTQRANLSVRGGGAVARYFVSGALNRDNGLLKQAGKSNFNSNIKLNTYNLRSNVNVNITKTTELVVRLHGSFDDYNGPIPGGSSVYGMIMNANPVLFPAYYENTAGYEHVKHVMFGNIEKEGDYLNPYAEVAKGYLEKSRSNMYAQIELYQDLKDLTEGLNFRMMGNTTRNAYFDITRAYKPYYYGPGDINTSTGQTGIRLLNETKGTEYLDYEQGGKDMNSVLYFEAGLNYNRMFSEKHHITGMLVSILRHSINGNSTELQASLPFRNAGLSGKATYAYDSRYYAEVNFGYNGSERFNKENRFGFFPSAGLAWSISNEKFWEPIKPVISNLRLRGTYGLVGNDQIGSANDRFFYLSEVNLNDKGKGAQFGTNYEMFRPGISVVRYANPEISWETAYKTNFALELGLFNRFQLIAEYFEDRRKNILMERADLPETMGLSSTIKANVGEAFSKGVDGSLSYQQQITPSWWIQSQGNFTYAAGKYTAYEELDWGVDYKQKVGKSLNQRMGYVAERLFVSDEEVRNSPTQIFTGGQARGGDIKYLDINGDGVIDEFDMVPIGHSTSPEIVYGFGFSTGYKGIDFSAFFQGLARESFWIDPNATAPFTLTGGSGSYGNRQLIKAYAENHWSEENQDIYALYPRFSPAPIENNTQSSTWWMRDGAFLRLKNVELGYTIPKRIMNQVKIDMLRVYVNVTNPIVFSRFKLWDVEMAGNGLGYPIQRVFNMGVNISL